ncbi:transmembrane protein 221 [Anolis sagrei]|uniref:transmembrane protein 221 n=1 Tax=Anolis sagrei TaxID=38937 RepID=UPI00295AD49C|nr:transmembrane protein 221 [Anolis sagrei ordinatus]
MASSSSSSSQYAPRALGALSLLGTGSGLVSVLGSLLLFQARAGVLPPGPSPASLALPEASRRALLSLSAVGAALCLALSLACLLLALLHSYCAAERCAPQPEPHPGPHSSDRFLLDSRKVRHVAVGLFCCAVSVYLAALSMYMLVLFELETGVAGACILSSGVVVLILTVTHVLIRASRASRHIHLPHALYENGSAGLDLPLPAAHLNNAREMCLTGSTCSGGKAPSSSGLGPASEEDCYAAPRMHRTLSADSALLAVQGKPWNSVAQEMKNALARKPASSGKDSTLV